MAKRLTYGEDFTRAVHTWQMPDKQIADHFGCSIHTVVTRRYRTRGWTPDDNR